MPNKDKPTMDYWKHSTILFDEMPMKLLRARVGAIGYAIYCYLMEKINRIINAPFVLSDDVVFLTMADLQIDKETFNSALSSMFDLKIFDKKIYEKDKILTNTESEDNKNLVIEARGKVKERVKKYRSKKDCNRLQSDKYNDNVLNKDIENKDIDIEIDKEKNKNNLDIEELEVDTERINLEIDDEIVESMEELYQYVSYHLDIVPFTKGYRHMIKNLYRNNPKQLSLAISRCKFFDYKSDPNAIISEFYNKDRSDINGES